MAQSESRMTVEELEAVVDRMRMSDEDRAALKRQLCEGSTNARFAIYAWSRRRGVQG